MVQDHRMVLDALYGSDIPGNCVLLYLPYMFCDDDDETLAPAAPSFFVPRQSVYSRGARNIYICHRIDPAEQLLAPVSDGYSMYIYIYTRYD